jgi:hypothetical protein
MPPALFDPADEDAVSYRGLSALAVVGLLAGAASPLAMVGTSFWLLPAAATLLSALALRQIAAQAPNLVGRKAALAGLLLGATFLVAAPADVAIYRYFVRREARQFADTWIKHVRRGEVYFAHDLMIDPRRRVPSDVPPDTTLEEHFAQYYARSDFQKRMLPLFIDQPLVRTLFALGPSAEYRFYETAGEGGADNGDYVTSTYAVTYTDEENRKKTFFINLPMSRTVDRETNHCDWTMGKIDGPVKPPGW